MALSYVLGPNPKWYIADNYGRPAGGASMYTYSSLIKTTQKFVFQDPAGVFPWPDPILFDENGTQGPFYWAIDSANPQNTYYIEVFDAQGNLLWNIDGYLPNGGGGGGGTITTGLNLTNLIVNNVFWRNYGTIGTPFATTYYLPIAPSTHAGLSLTSIYPASPASNAGPDIVFIKNNLSGTDTLNFKPFTFGTNFLTGDVTPQTYLEYACTGAGSAETVKCIQYPITQGVNNLSNQAAKISIWAQSTSGSNSLTLSWYQFFGDGAGATAPITTLITTLTLSNTWVNYEVTATIPSVSAKVLGGCGNDGLFLQVGYPLNIATNIDHVKPFVVLGNIIPDIDYVNNDMIDAVINTPRTGDIRIANNNYQFGYVLMDDGTIGNASSNATTRANVDTFPLFNLIYTNVSNTYAPMYNSAGALTARTNAVADFTANNQLSLTRQLGRVIAGTLPVQVARPFTAVGNVLTLSSTAAFTLGAPVVFSTTGTLPAPLVINQTYYAVPLTLTTMSLATTAENAYANIVITLTTAGTPTNTISVTPNVLGSYIGSRDAILPAHTHGIIYSPTVTSVYGVGGSSGFAGGGNTETITTLSIASAGVSPVDGNLQPTVFQNIFMKL